MPDEGQTPTPDLNNPDRALTPSEQAMSDTAAPRTGRRGKVAEPAAKPVRYKDPLDLATTFRTHLKKHTPQRRDELERKLRDVVLDPDALAFVKAVDDLTGAIDAGDISVAKATALHRLS